MRGKIKLNRRIIKNGFLFRIKIFHPLLIRVSESLLFISVLLIICFFAADSALSPAVYKLALVKARSSAVEAVEAAAESVITESGINYGDISVFKTDSYGNITAITNDIVKMNLLKAKITRAANDALKKLNDSEISVPLGAATGISFLSGSGPRIKANLSLSGNVCSDYENVFCSTGINQTEHRVMLKINAELVFALNKRTEQVLINTSVCIAQTVIVGVVPEIERE